MLAVGRGGRGWDRLAPKCFARDKLRGSHVRFMILPDMLKHAPMFNRIDPKQGPPPLNTATSLAHVLTTPLQALSPLPPSYSSRVCCIIAQPCCLQVFCVARASAWTVAAAAGAGEACAVAEHVFAVNCCCDASMWSGEVCVGLLHGNSTASD